MIRKEKEDDSLVNKGRTNNIPRNNDSLKGKIDERLKSIERSMIYTQDNGLAELAKKIEILNSPLDIDRERDITDLNTTELSNNEKTNRHIRNTICHKCKLYGTVVPRYNWALNSNPATWPTSPIAFHPKIELEPTRIVSPSFVTRPLLGKPFPNDKG